MVKRLATSPHDPLGITDSARKNQSVVVSVQYGPFNPYIPIRSTTIGKSRVAIDPITMHTSWRSNSDIASVTSIGYPRMSASGESSTTMHRILHASGSHPIPTPYDPNSELNLLRLLFFRNGNDPLEDFDYSGPCCNPIRQSVNCKNSYPPMDTSTQAVCLTSLFYASVRKTTYTSLTSQCERLHRLF
ncbi:hypothetical protein F511_43049 [Dorcoceras hygrometricum]|uniref:Uncharacterized protein n=1 Tax=Dorcoceras hygrometricum TaxID=472368 RepID=A0A2Z7DA18_9LAMI|nr:hypothetical protein F511_43049 [Dorcoceras hygrometricum]